MSGPGAVALLVRLPEPYLLLRRDGRVVGANEKALQLLGIPPAAVPGEALTRHVREPDGVDAFLGRCHASGTMLPGRIMPLAQAKPIACRGCAVAPLDGGGGERLILLRLDPGDEASAHFTALTQKVEELTAETHRRRRTEQALQETQRRTALLAEASRVLGSSLDYEVTLRNVARMAVPALADWCAVDLLTPEGGLERVAVEHPDAERVQAVLAMQERYPPDMKAAFGAPAVIRSGRSEYAAEIPDALLVDVAVDAEHLRLIRSLGLRSYAVAPLLANTGVLGAVTFVYAESGRTYSDVDVPILEDLARRAATAIENARLVAAIDEARRRIEEQATELEAQTEELQAQSVQLEEQASELEHQLDEVAALNQRLGILNERLTDAHAESEAARLEAERASAAKSQFLAVMSHELRTPMNAILGFTDLLDAEIAGPLNDVQKTQLGRVRAGARHLLGLIDQVLSLARIEAGREHIHVDETDVAAIIRDVCSMLEPLATRRGLELRVALPEAMPRAHTDGGKLRQILLNLVGNAIKFTERGDVAVEVETTAAHVTVNVRDTGPGIDAADMERIFDPFEQVDQSITRRAEGSGLGLPVSRQLARLLGGDLSVTSAVGEGSVFALRLPWIAPAAVAESAT